MLLIKLVTYTKLYEKSDLCLLLFSVLACSKETSKERPEQVPLAAQTLPNVSYGNDEAQKMDIYLPMGKTDTTRVLVLVHGGARISGDKSDFATFVTALQQRFPAYAIANCLNSGLLV